MMVLRVTGMPYFALNLRAISPEDISIFHRLTQNSMCSVLYFRSIFFQHLI